MMSPSGSTVYGNGVGFKFQLAQLVVAGNVTTTTSAVPNYTEFTALFDRYRITNVRMRFHYSNNVAAASAATGTLTAVALPVMQIATDYDDALPPVNTGELMQRQTTKYWTLDSNGPKTYSVRPQVAVPVDNAGVSSSRSLGANLWIDAGSPNTDYFGVKLWMESQSNSGNNLMLGFIWVYVTYDLEFKDPR